MKSPRVNSRFGLRKFFSELIGGPRRLLIRWRDHMPYTTPTKDPTRSDYRFWDRARRCKAEGLELSGLFLRPLESKIAAWVLGRAPKWELSDEYTQDKLNTWWKDHLPQIIKAYRESVGLGDGVAVINADETITVIPPNAVEPIVNPDDFSEVIGWRITESYADPDSALNGSKIMTWVDEYYPDRRIRKQYLQSRLIDELEYPNLTGLQPVVFMANNQGSDELFGRAEAEALVPAMHEYGSIFSAALEGNVRQGRPVPVISKLGSVQEIAAFWARFGRKETQTLPDGTTESVDVLDLTSDDVITLSGEGEFNWKAPGPFAGDTQILLNLLFYLILQHSEIPEFIWGNAIQASRASAESQLGPFVKWIEMRQGFCRSWMIQMATVALSIMSLTDRRIQTDEVPAAKFNSLTEQDGRLTKETVAFALQAGLLDKATALTLLPLNIDNPAGILEQAAAEAEVERQQAEDAAMRQAEQEAMLAAASQPAPLPVSDSSGAQSNVKPIRAAA